MSPCIGSISSLARCSRNLAVSQKLYVIEFYFDLYQNHITSLACIFLHTFHLNQSYNLYMMGSKMLLT